MAPKKSPIPPGSTEPFSFVCVQLTVRCQFVTELNCPIKGGWTRHSRLIGGQTRFFHPDLRSRLSGDATVASGNTPVMSRAVTLSQSKWSYCPVFRDRASSNGSLTMTSRVWATSQRGHVQTERGWQVALRTQLRPDHSDHVGRRRRRREFYNAHR